MGGYGAHHHIIIRNNIVHDTPGSAIRFNDSDHITIEYNEVYNSTWWTSSASSAVVFAETISASEEDNGNEIKMIMRGNTVYNNWNRIPFYVTQLPDNSGNTNPDYGTATYNNILDGQGLYVTRSDPDYNGTFYLKIIFVSIMVRTGLILIIHYRPLQFFKTIQYTTMVFMK